MDLTAVLTNEDDFDNLIDDHDGHFHEPANEEIYEEPVVQTPPPAIPVEDEVRKVSVKDLKTYSLHTDPSVRYFTLRSNTAENIVKSIDTNVWATQRHNERLLDSAFQESKCVVLVFSINQSSAFQGYAQMLSPIGASRHNPFEIRGRDGKRQPWGRPFRLKWLRKTELSFDATLYLMNPWNENKPVRTARDGQEMPFSVGSKLCLMFDQQCIDILNGDPHKIEEIDVAPEVVMMEHRQLNSSMNRTFNAKLNDMNVRGGDAGSKLEATQGALDETPPSPHVRPSSLPNFAQMVKPDIHLILNSQSNVGLSYLFYECGNLFGVFCSIKHWFCY
eukprot:GHVL01016867.1.p1 GENE.GHVL01016867.1~~GHVL01016867.1.p1  ORF type:complete len:333 (-),score=55.94 GHVL01016867.1:1399-2397(-)